MESCNCIEPHGQTDDLLMKYQYISDFFIALAYFSIPLELVYFVKKSSVFPYRWVLVQFGAFIVLCGATHLINLWMFAVHSRTVEIIQTIAKVLTALVSCVTALMLVHIIPDLLSVKTRELFLKNKAEELDREMGLIRTQEETGRHVRMLTHEIRSTLDRHTILRTTFIELGRTLALEECALWMPTHSGLELQLAYTLRQQNPVGYTVPIQLPVISQVFNTNSAVRISPNCPVARIRPVAGRYMPGEVVAVRVPLLHLSNFQNDDWPELSTKRYAVMVLMLPSDSARQWHVHELELVEVVADQVAVALSHAAILEESMRAQEQLIQQNIALDLARQEAETVIRARNDFLAVMNHEMRTPMHGIIALSSLLQETELTPEQRLMVETVLKSSNLLATLINDVVDLSRLEDGSLRLDRGTFNLHALFREVFNLVKPIASVKQLTLTLDLAQDIPEFAVGDDKRLMQILLNIVGNAVKFSKAGIVSIKAVVAKSVSSRDSPASESRDSPASELISLKTGDLFYLEVQVKDSGPGVNPHDIPKLFTKFADSKYLTSKDSPGAGLGLAICKRFVTLMEGHIWIESQGVGKGCTVAFMVKIGLPKQSHQTKSLLDTKLQPKLTQTSLSGLKVLLVDENGFSRTVTKGLLLHLGCEVTTCSLDKCLRIVSSDYKVAVLDLCMPGVEGYDISVQIRRKFMRQHGRPLLLGVIANGDQITRESCIRIGVDSCIPKPISVDNMRTALFELLER